MSFCAVKLDTFCCVDESESCEDGQCRGGGTTALQEGGALLPYPPLHTLTPGWATLSDNM